MSKPTWDDTEEIVPTQQSAGPSWDETEDVPSRTESVARGAAQGLSLGFADEISGAAGGMWDDLQKALAGESGPKATYDEFGRVSNAAELNKNATYSKRRDESRDANRKAQEANPGSYVGGELAGSLATAFVPGLNVAKGATLAARAGQAAAMGGASGLGMSEEESLTGMAQDTAIGAGLGAGFTVGGEKILAPLLSKASGAASRVGSKIAQKADEWSDDLLKKSGRVGANVPEEVTEKYLSNPSKYRGEIKPLEGIKDDIDQLVQKNVETAELAKQSHKQVESQYAEAIAQKRMELDELYQKSRDSVGEAKLAYQNEFNLKRDELNDTIGSIRKGAEGTQLQWREAAKDLQYNLEKVHPPPDTVERVSDAIQALKSDISAGSSQAFDTLAKKGHVFPRKYFEKAYTSAIKSLEVEGRAPVSPEALKEYNALVSELVRVKELPETLQLPSVKRLIQDLDDSVEYAQRFGDVSSRGNVARTKIRGSIDGLLKQGVPEYRRVMAEVSRKAELLSQVNQRFGTPERIVNQVRGLSGANNTRDLQLLQKLQTETRTDLAKPLAPYLESRKILSDSKLLEEAKKALPLYSQWKQAEAAARGVESSAYKRGQKISEEIRSTSSGKNLSIAQSELEKLPPTATARQRAAKGSIDSETDFLDRVSDSFLEAERTKALSDERYISPNRSENVVKSYLRNTPKIEDVRRVEALGGAQLADDLDKLRVTNAFEKGDTAGSRKTIMGAIAGKAFGSVVGGVAGYETSESPIGALVGATAGFSGDRYAGKVFKQVLNAKIGAKEGIAALAPKLGKYAKVLTDAASRGNQSLAATHFLLSQQDPAYRQQLKALEDQDDEQ